MARSITTKTVQVHKQCSCGYNLLDQVKKNIRFKDLATAGIRYKKDPSTGKYFFVQVLQEVCDGAGHYE